MRTPPFTRRNPLRSAPLFAFAIVACAATTLGVVGTERAAQACGGCFVPPGPGTQVSAHRMAFAISNKRTVLWDQIQYVGDPKEFGWVLPIAGVVDVGVSTDTLFQRLEGATQPRISQPPPPKCPEPKKVCQTQCNKFAAPSAGASEGGGSAADSGVDVWRSEVVGPYETTQLSAKDATALQTWLKDHGYTLPESITPVIDSYIREGFGFLAIKLVPKTGIRSMVPIRIGFPGASPTLPLRMIAAGTGAQVGIKLWVLGEGRWEAKNFAADEVATADLVWDWRAMGSNFGQLEQAILDKNKGAVWIAETSDSFPRGSFFAGLPTGKSEGDAGAALSKVTDEIEIEAAFPGRSELIVTRLFASLPREALGTDLQIQASLRGPIPANRVPPKSVNYFCPEVVEEYCAGITPKDCGGPSGPGLPGGSGGWGSSGSEPSRAQSGTGGSSSAFGCTTTPASSRSGDGGSLGWMGLGLLGVVASGIARRRAARRA